VVISATGGVTALADTLFPSDSIADGLSEAVGDAEHFLTRLRVIHPVVAVAIGAFTGWMAWTFGVDADNRLTQRLAMTIIGLVAVQFFVGMANIVLGTPVWLQLTHLTLADLLWLALVFFGASSLELDRTPA
jgi:heme A synthase